jgi:hypothetical protein
MTSLCEGCMAYKNLHRTCEVIEMSKCPCRECIIKVVCQKICREFSKAFNICLLND